MILLKNISQLIGILPSEIRKLSGKEMAYVKTLKNAYLLIEDDLINDFGLMSDLNLDLDCKEIDCTGKIVGPSFCDSHTHLVFASGRESEFADRINGLSYEEIAKRGGGILNSAQKLNQTSEDELVESALIRLQEIKKTGTGAVEIKSGYGLTLESELKMLRVIKRLKLMSELEVKATFLGAHAFPLQFKENHEGYINLLINEMLPAIAAENLADYIDVFCEKGFFSESETDEILKAGIKFGLIPKIHANQLFISGGVQVGINNNALSVDHLECIGNEEIQLLKNSETIGTILPSAAFFLGMHYQPARKMIDSGLAVSMASDYNPGSTPSGNIPFLLSLACTQMKMTPEEAFNAVTINGAYAIGLERSHGSITVGKRANVFITEKLPSLASIPYYFGRNVMENVILNGKISN